MKYIRTFALHSTCMHPCGVIWSWLHKVEVSFPLIHYQKIVASRLLWMEKSTWGSKGEFILYGCWDVLTLILLYLWSPFGVQKEQQQSLATTTMKKTKHLQRSHGHVLPLHDTQDLHTLASVFISYGSTRACHLHNQVGPLYM